MIKKLKAEKYTHLICFFVFIIFIFSIMGYYVDVHIENNTRPYITKTIGQLPFNEFGIVLGTSRYTKNGYKNRHYYERLDAAVNLYQQRKIKYILVSGYREDQYYDEPKHMKNYLISQHIPSSVIYQDFKGTRTIQSILRAKTIFNLSSFTIITQGYQNERAVYIARENNINAIGWSANGDFPKSDITSTIREYLARVLVFYEVQIQEVNPNYLILPTLLSQN